MIDNKDITEVQPMNDPNKEPVIMWSKTTLKASQHTKKGFIKRMTNHMIKQARALLDGGN
jgi:hypothetical protein